MDNLEIFDKEGNKLEMADAIYSFLKDKAEESGKDIEDLYVSAYTFKDTWIETFEATDNGYDGTDLCQVGKGIKVNLK